MDKKLFLPLPWITQCTTSVLGLQLTLQDEGRWEATTMQITKQTLKLQPPAHASQARSVNCRNGSTQVFNAVLLTCHTHTLKPFIAMIVSLFPDSMTWLALHICSTEVQSSRHFWCEWQHWTQEIFSITVALENNLEESKPRHATPDTRSHLLLSKMIKRPSSSTFSSTLALYTTNLKQLSP